MNFSKFGDSHHAQDFFIMIRYAGDSDDLLVFLGLSQKLNQYGDPAAINIGVSVDLQQDFSGSLIAGVFVGVGHKGFGKRTGFDAYRMQSRGGSGVINLKVVAKNGSVVGIKSVRENDELRHNP